MEEILFSIHNYTKFSGNGVSFYDIAQAALDCGLDTVITTDKNIYPRGHDQYYYRDGRRLILMCGEELFDPLQEEPGRYLSLGIEKEQFNRTPGNPLDEIRVQIDPSKRKTNLRHVELINSQDLLVSGFSSAQKTFRKNIGIFDELLQTDQHFIGIAGTCSSLDIAPFKYKELFSTVCNHILSEDPLTGDFIHDKLLVRKAIKQGRFFIGIDGLADTRGFSFTAEGENLSKPAFPGDTIYLKSSVTLKIKSPEACVCRLIRNGKVLREWQQCRQVPFTLYEPGYYRAECALIRRNTEYDWIFSNPVYVVKG